ncbi:MAG: dockerin type I domain-containing protein [Candidatus Poribacteria bacterium]|nr:dockerin type I domain-containing protein [Candidatus Poribacteria bacterium]
MRFMKFKHLFLTIIVLLSFLCSSFAQEPIILRHGGSVQTVKFSPVDASLLASAGDTHTIKLWDLQNDTVSTLRGHSGQINSIAFSPDGQLLASGGDDWTFRLWDVRTRQNIATLEHINGQTRHQIKAVAFSPDGQLLATAGGHVKLWDIRTQTEIATLQHSKYVWALAFSPDGQLLAAGNKVWNLQEREAITQIESDHFLMKALDFSPDGRTFARAVPIKLWNTSDWSLLGTIQHRGITFTLDFSPDGKTLASGGDEEVTLLSVESGKNIVSLRGHSGFVNGTAFSSDGKSLASGGDDGTVRVQNIESYLQPSPLREMVRLIYFLPLNRRAQPDIDTKLDTLIKDVQQLYANQMEAHGFGRKTFTFETDATGKAVVHHVSGKFTDQYYDAEPFKGILGEIEQQFDLSTNFYLISIDTGSERIAVGLHGAGVGGLGNHRGGSGGWAIVPASGDAFGLWVAAHELGHAFGLYHDLDTGNSQRISIFTQDRMLNSFCTAEWLNAHRAFNPERQLEFDVYPQFIVHPPSLAAPPNDIRLRFEINDPNGIHQVQLVAITPLNSVLGCKSLNGNISATVEFVINDLTPKAKDFALNTKDFTLNTIDVLGNLAVGGGFSIDITDVVLPGHHVAEDVNADGEVNILDMILVAQQLGSVAAANAKVDVNRDGVISILDLILVAQQMGESTASDAPPILAMNNIDELDPARVQVWIAQAQIENDGSVAFSEGITYLQSLLALLVPTETALLPNYPNPFNPETWIPYQLSEPSDVSLAIYAADGSLVRTLDLGHQPMGIYESRSRAAYWDGKNALGERVASGVYFYILTAGDFTATRKMLIRK